MCNSDSPSLRLELMEATFSSDCLRPNGTIRVQVKNGVAPFLYSINNGAGQSEGTFHGLFAGDHLVSVKDAIGCTGFLTVFVAPLGAVVEATLTAAPDDRCFSNAGSITVRATGGERPYQYKIDSLPYRSDSIFYQLDKGSYWVRVRDNKGCEFQRRVKVEHGSTGVSYVKHVQPLVNLYCAYEGCHNGDVGPITNFTLFNVVKSYGGIIVRYSANGHLLKPVPDNEIQYIRCWIEDGYPNN
jgi:hypothetical protein